MRQAGFDAIERAVEDHAGDRAPVRKRHRFERLLHAHRGVIDQNVDTAEARRRGGDHGRNRVGVGDIGGDGERLPAAAFDLARDGLGFLQVRARVDDDRCAGIRERERNAAPDIASGAGDDGDAA